MPLRLCASTCDHRICCRGRSTWLRVGLQGVIPGILALLLIPPVKTVESLLGIMLRQAQGKPREGVCNVFSVDTLSPSSWAMTWSRFKNFTFLQRKTPPTPPSDGKPRNPSPPHTTTQIAPLGPPPDHPKLPHLDPPAPTDPPGAPPPSPS